jgi:hypothetical protein
MKFMCGEFMKSGKTYVIRGRFFQVCVYVTRPTANSVYRIKLGTDSKDSNLWSEFLSIGAIRYLWMI